MFFMVTICTIYNTVVLFNYLFSLAPTIANTNKFFPFLDTYVTLSLRKVTLFANIQQIERFI